MLIAYQATQQYMRAMEGLAADFEINEYGEILTTLYFVAPFGEQLGPGRSVRIYGEFTTFPWTEYMPCFFDHDRGLYGFKTATLIGGQFKFFVDEWRHMASMAYDIVTDQHGNHNNVFLPRHFFEKFGVVDKTETLGKAFEHLFSQVEWLQKFIRPDLNPNNKPSAHLANDAQQHVLLENELEDFLQQQYGNGQSNRENILNFLFKKNYGQDRQITNGEGQAEAADSFTDFNKVEVAKAYTEQETKAELSAGQNDSMSNPAFNESDSDVSKLDTPEKLKDGQVDVELQESLEQKRKECEGLNTQIRDLHDSVKDYREQIEKCKADQDAKEK